MRVTFQGRAPVREVLGKILGPDLDYRWMNRGLLQVAARRPPSENLPVVTYPLGETLCGPYAQAHPAPPGFRPAYNADSGEIDYSELIDMIRKAVNHKTDPDVAAWSDEGGPADIQHLGGMIIASQTKQGHARIIAFLMDLYKKRFTDAK